MKKSCSPFLSIAVLLFLLARPELSLEGARKGLLLWANVVLPTLLPFMICSGTIVALGGVPILVRPFRPFLKKVFHFTEAGSFVFLTGLLCGYPMGAKADGEFLSCGMITPEEGKYLLAVSNHPSPMFLLGYVMAAWKQKGLPLLLLSIYLPLFPLSAAARKVYGFSSRKASAENTSASSQNVFLQQTFPGRPSNTFSFDKSMMDSFEVMVKIGGYIMLFSIGAEYIRALSPFSAEINAVLLGITEITTGIHQISLVMEGLPLRLSVTGITVFGGLSGIFQTKSVLNSFPSKEINKNAGLSIRHYVIWKIIHAALSCLILALLSLLPLPEAVRHF